MPPKAFKKLPRIESIGESNDLGRAVLGRQLYRALLRSASYLPDPYVRSYVHNHVVSKFKKNASRKTPTDRKHLSKRLKLARHECQVLERAGLGHLDSLEKVIREAYGRRGPRRRQLIREFLNTDESNLPSDHEAVQRLLNGEQGQLEAFKLSPKFEALVKSQKARPPLDTSYGLSKTQLDKPKADETNIWGRPIPQKVALNRRKEWWAELLSKFLPPVPKEDWDRLQAISLGSIKLSIAPRRIRGQSLDRCNSEEKDFSYTAREHAPIVGYTPAPLRDIFSHKFGRGVTQGLADSTTIGLIAKMKLLRDPYQLRHSLLEAEAEDWKTTWTQRRVRRLYASVWNLCATISCDSEPPLSNTWKITWGGQRSRAREGNYTEASRGDFEFFEGLGSSASTTDASTSILKLGNMVGTQARTGKKIDSEVQKSEFSGKTSSYGQLDFPNRRKPPSEKTPPKSSKKSSSN